MDSPYKRQLNSSTGRIIRVLRLNPAPFSSEAPVSGVLEEVPIGLSSYDALSYQWGSDEPAIRVILGDSYVLVTQNCYAALRRLRDRYRKRARWIDAICINQQDDLEKGYQVKMMLEIYRQASRVFVWLGESNEDTDYVLKWCLQTSRLSPGWMVVKANYQLPSALEFSNMRRLCLCIWEIIASQLLRLRLWVFPSYKLAPRDDAIDRLFENGWFTRSWVVQEVAMAAEPYILCGNNSIYWKHLVYLHTAGRENLHPNTRGPAVNAVRCIQFLWTTSYFERFTTPRLRYWKSIIETLKIKSIKTMIDTMHRSKYLIISCLCGSMAFVVNGRYARGVWRMHNSEPDAWILVTLICFTATAMIFLSPPRQFGPEFLFAGRSIVLNVIQPIRQLNSSDPRDKVFALHGTLTKLGIRLDDPDYSINTATEQVYFSFTRHIIEWQGSLEIISEASFPWLQGVPSWVPDLRRPSCVLRSLDLEIYKAAANSKPDYTLNENTIETKGKLLDISSCWVESVKNSTTGFLTKEHDYQGFTEAPLKISDTLALISGLNLPVLLRQVNAGYQIVGVAFVKDVMHGKAWESDPRLQTFTLV